MTLEIFIRITDYTLEVVTIFMATRTLVEGGGHDGHGRGNASHPTGQVCGRQWHITTNLIKFFNFCKVIH